MERNIFNYHCKLLTDNTNIFSFSTGNGIIKSNAVAAAMDAVDRKHYSPHSPYQDSPQSIGYLTTISAPHMVYQQEIPKLNNILSTDLIYLLKIHYQNHNKTILEKCM